MERRFTQSLILGLTGLTGLTVLTVLAVACGGGGGSQAPAPSAPPATVAVVGTVAGTSSAPTFNRLPLLTGSALVTAQGKPSTPSKIQPGSVIRGTLSGMNLAATWVKVETGLEDLPGSELEVSGTISGLDPVAKTFMLMSYKVDFSAAKVEGTLADGARVEVEGILGTGMAPILMAKEVEVSFTDSGSGSSDQER
ncbi:MAG: hypothetical protein Q8K67_07545 [Geothrix sp.]|nr:hypothetical protein [Geothrix sp.]